MAELRKKHLRLKNNSLVKFDEVIPIGQPNTQAVTGRSSLAGLLHKWGEAQTKT